MDAGQIQIQVLIMGALGPTRWPLSGAVCTAPFRQGFSQITCER
jgi:hypothetical protein